MCPSFPIRSTMAQCSSRRCRWPKSSPADSRRRSPQPNRVAISARSRLPFRNAGFGSCQRVLASFAVSQFPIREPSILAHLTRRTLAANSGLSRLAWAGFIGDTAQCCQTAIDRFWCQKAGFEVDAISGHDGFVEGKSRFRAIPSNKLIDCVTITPLRIRGTQAIEHSAPRLIKVGKAKLAPNGNLLPSVCPLSSFHSRRPPCR